MAIYGDSFSEAGTHADDLFERRGFWNTIVNDWVLSNVLVVSTFGVGLLTALYAFMLGQFILEHPSKHAGVLGLAGLAIGCLTAQITFGAISSAVATIYVSFADDPGAIKKNHPEAFKQLFDGWNLAYPQVLTHIVLVEDFQLP